jgi:hypothetical protein
MGWRDLLSASQTLILPWVGGRRLRKDEEVWTLERMLPQEHCWASFVCGTSRKAVYEGASNPNPEILKFQVIGYLVGNRLVPDDARVDPDPLKIADQTEEVYLIEPGLDRFARVSAGRLFDEGPLVFRSQEFPLGAEDQVLTAFLDEKPIDMVKQVTPALEAAFRMETYQRAETRRRREELERRLREEAEKQAKEERRQALIQKLGDGLGRREMAVADFEQASRAALAVGGAVYLDHRRAAAKQEMVVRFRLLDRRFECVCNAKTLQIIDAGICLNAHYDDPDFETGTKGDTWLTLESLPMVIAQAQRERKLVVFRHVDD